VSLTIIFCSLITHLPAVGTMELDVGFTKSGVVMLSGTWTAMRSCGHGGFISMAVLMDTRR
jgi:hypothetical protein